MSGPVELVGGPLDGHVITAPGGRYAWVSAARLAWRERFGLILSRFAHFRGGGATATPTDGRALYEVSCRGYAVYAGHRTTYCPGCGCYHGRVEGGSERRACPLGGHRK